jgi:hypothetical protein
MAVQKDGGKEKTKIGGKAKKQKSRQGRLRGADRRAA